MTMTDIPRAIHRSEDDLPFIDFGDGMKIQLLQVDIDLGLWVVRSRFDAGVTIPKHKHTGAVHAFTLSGRWKYVEYPEVNTPGSYLYEPAGSIHTLTVPEDVQGVTDVWFAIYGANLNYGPDGNIDLVIDAGLIRDAYFGACEAQGLPRPDVIGA